MFRMLDIPIAQIKRILAGEISLQEAMKQQQDAFEESAQRLQDAIVMCKGLAQTNETLESLDIDRQLQQMEAKGIISICESE